MKLKKEKQEALIELSKSIGFAISVIKSFITPGGTSSEQIREAIERLECSTSNVQELMK